MIKKLTLATLEETKRGEGKYGLWIRYKVTDINGDEFKSFDQKLSDCLGKEVECEVWEDKREYNGKFYVDKMVKLSVCKNCSQHCPNVKHS